MIRFVVSNEYTLNFSRLRHHQLSRELEAVVRRLPLFEEALEEVRLKESRIGVLFHKSFNALLRSLEGLRIRTRQISLRCFTCLRVEVDLKKKED